MEIIPILHNVRSIHNVGSIFRTAECAGCKSIYLSGYTGTPLDRFGKVRGDFLKTALGAEKSLKWKYSKNFSDVFKKLKKQGYFFVALEQSEKSIEYTKFKKYFPKEKKIALVLGNEPKGIDQKVLKNMDAIVEIPMKGKKESLNVSVAFGIAIFKLGF